MAKTNNPHGFAALKAAISSAQQQITTVQQQVTAVIPRITKLEQVYESTSKVVASTVVTIPVAKATSSTTVTLAAECDYVVCGSNTIANGGRAQWGIYERLTDGSYEYRTITCSLANKKTLSVSWSALSANMASTSSLNFVGYKYLV